MYMCICAAVTDTEVRSCIARGALTVEDVGEACEAGTGCGSCHDEIDFEIEVFVPARCAPCDLAGEQLQSDLAIELAVGERLRPGIIMCREKGDATSANLFEEILADEEHHIDYIETNLYLIDQLGEQLYLAQLVDQPPTPG